MSRSLVPLASAVLLTLALVACGDDPAPVSDAATGVDGGGSPADIPWLADGTPAIAPPSLTPCPTGWREVTLEDTTHCEPFPEDGPADCPAGQAHFVGEPGCVLVGDPCPAGDFAEGLPSDGTVVYVRSGATAGDGSLAAPLGALSEVRFSTMPSGSTLALAKGTHAGVLPLRAGIHVVGACAGETFLTGLVGPAQAVVTVVSGGEPAELRSVTVRDPPQPAVLVNGVGVGLRLRGVIVVGATPFALGVGGGELDAEGIAIQSTHDVTAGESGMGLYAVGGRARIARAVFDDNHYAALYAEGTTTAVSVTDAYVHDTTADVVTRTLGRGLNARLGAQFDVSRALFSTNRDSVAVVDEGSVARLEHVVIRDTLRDATDPARGGFTLAAVEAGRIEGTAVLLEGNDDSGAYADAADAWLSLSDSVIRDVRVPEGEDLRGFGLHVFDAHAELSRVVVERTASHGVLAGDGARASLTDVVVRDVRVPRADERFGRGLGVQSGAAVTVERARFERTSEVAVFGIDPGTEVMLTDVVVRDTASRPTHGDFGRGLVSQTGAGVTGVRVLIEHSHEVGLLAMLGASVSIQDAIVADTVSNTCTVGACADTPLGYGVAGLAGGSIDLAAFAVRDSELCGVFVDVGSSITLVDGEIQRAAIGACVQDPTYDLARLSSEVAYRDNGVNLDSTNLPVPDASPPAL